MIQIISELIKQMKTPFYLFDEKGFVDNYMKLEDTFRSIYPEYRISYSYKTNYTPFVCQLVKSLGGYAEVVSDLEYALAKKLGYDNTQIVYNGPSKGSTIYEHLENGGILNIDSLDEANRIVAYCKSNPGNHYTCGVRINLNLGAGFISRFGMEDDSTELLETIRIINKTDNLQLVGLHCHISRCRSLEAWRQRAQHMIAMADKYIEGTPSYISLGSGMFGDMPEYLKNQFGGDSVPNYSDYAEATIRAFADHYKNHARRPILFTEPGTTVIARYIKFASKVLSIKEVCNRHIANMDGNFHNLGEICLLKKLPVTVIPGGNKQHVYPHLDIMGCTCLEQDVMSSDFNLPLAEDDVLVFDNVGGYSIVLKPQFIMPQCAMYAACSDGSIKTIMREESFDDIFDKFIF